MRSRTKELARVISKEFDGKDITCLVVLKGAAYFGMELFKELGVMHDCGVEVEFVKAKVCFCFFVFLFFLFFVF